MKKIFCVVAGFALAVSSNCFAVDAKVNDQSNQGMSDALTGLNAAMASLKSDRGDKGGHRGAAMKLIDQAIAEVNAGVAYDEAHLSDKEGGTRSADRAKAKAEKQVEKKAERRAAEKAAAE